MDRKLFGQVLLRHFVRERPKKGRMLDCATTTTMARQTENNRMLIALAVELTVKNGPSFSVFFSRAMRICPPLSVEGSVGILFCCCLFGGTFREINELEWGWKVEGN